MARGLVTPHSLSSCRRALTFVRVWPLSANRCPTSDCWIQWRAASSPTLALEHVAHVRHLDDADECAEELLLIFPHSVVKKRHTICRMGGGVTLSASC